MEKSRLLGFDFLSRRTQAFKSFQTSSGRRTGEALILAHTELQQGNWIFARVTSPTTYIDRGVLENPQNKPEKLVIMDNGKFN